MICLSVDKRELLLLFLAVAFRSAAPLAVVENGASSRWIMIVMTPVGPAAVRSFNGQSSRCNELLTAAALDLFASCSTAEALSVDKRVCLLYSFEPLDLGQPSSLIVSLSSADQRFISALYAAFAASSRLFAATALLSMALPSRRVVSQDTAKQANARRTEPIYIVQSIHL